MKKSKIQQDEDEEEEEAGNNKDFHKARGFTWVPDSYSQADEVQNLFREETKEEPHVTPNIADKHIDTDGTVIIEYTQEQMDELTKNNERANQIYAESPEGRAEYDEPIQELLWLQVYNQRSAQKQPFEQRNIKVNKLGTLFITREDNDIRAVDTSLSLLDLVSEQDTDLINGRCCENVGLLDEEPQLRNVPNQDGIASVYCFILNENDEIWTLCDEERNKIAIFRNAIKQVIITNYAEEHGQRRPVFIIDAAALRSSDNDFSWDMQSEWVNTCKSGKFQSPIDIELKHSHESLNPIAFEYLDFTPATVQQVGGEAQVTGAFGTMITKNQAGEQEEFQAYKVVFKFPAEHILDGVTHLGEIQVWHTSNSSSQAVVSFFIQEDDEVENAFLNDLNPHLWDLHKGPTELNKVSLNLAAVGGIKQSLNKSFFYYRGSESTPPCKEGLERFIIETPITADSKIIAALKEKAWDHEKSRSNARQTHSFTDLVTYYQDLSEYINPNYPESIQEALSERINQYQLSDLQNEPPKLNEQEGDDDEGDEGDDDEDDNSDYDDNVPEDPTLQSDDEEVEKGKFVKTTTKLQQLSAHDPLEEIPEGAVKIDDRALPKSIKVDLVKGSTPEGLYKIPPAEDQPVEAEDEPVEAEDGQATEESKKKKHHKHR